MDEKIVIIGGGPGGYAAAIRAAQLGGKVILIEKSKIGGTCLNEGCIPTKALYRSAEIINNIRNSDNFGVSVSEFKVNMDQIQNRKNQIVMELSKGISQLLKANKIEVINGSAAFVNNNTLMITEENGHEYELKCKDIIIAAGSQSSILKIDGNAQGEILTSEDILKLDTIPKSLAIVGGGVIGMEFAGIFNSLGTKVTVIEFLPDILNNLDSDIKKRYTVLAKKQGIDIYTNAKVSRIDKSENQYFIEAEGFKGKINITCEKVLMATGRKPQIANLGLENTDIEYGNKGIAVDGNYMTNVKNIFAIGDVNGISMLAHSASYQGEVVAAYLLDGRKEEKKPLVPSCVYVFPEIASVGMTEDEAKIKSISYSTSKFMFGANGKALTLGETQGFIKLIAMNHPGSIKGEQTIIGAHIMGPHASDLIHECAVVIDKQIKIDDIKDIIHAHPTLSEVFIEAINALIDKAIHIAPPRKK